jgi:hypothetical protein
LNKDDLKRGNMWLRLKDEEFKDKVIFKCVCSESHCAVCGHDVFHLEARLTTDTFCPEANGRHVFESSRIRAVTRAITAGVDDLTGRRVPIV